jgi:hypothetical protein
MFEGKAHGISKPAPSRVGIALFGPDGTEQKNVILVCLNPPSGGGRTEIKNLIII